MLGTEMQFCWVRDGEKQIQSEGRRCKATASTDFNLCRHAVWLACRTTERLTKQQQQQWRLMLKYATSFSSHAGASCHVKWVKSTETFPHALKAFFFRLPEPRPRMINRAANVEVEASSIRRVPATRLYVRAAC